MTRALSACAENAIEHAMALRRRSCSERLEGRTLGPAPHDHQQRRPGVLLLDEAVGKRFGGVDIANADAELAPAIALRRHAEG
jgi:hypothetical protein